MPALTHRLAPATSFALALGLIAGSGCVDSGSEPPTPYFRCQGNEPFWNLVVRGDEGVFTALGETEKSLTARWQWDTSATPILDWKARHEGEAVSFFFASIREQECFDTMSDETPPFTHRIDLVTSDRGHVMGCCRVASDSS